MPKIRLDLDLLRLPVAALPAEDCGLLMKLVVAYCYGETLPDAPMNVQAVFELVRAALEAEARKREAAAESHRLAGAKGGRPKKKAVPAKAEAKQAPAPVQEASFISIPLNDGSEYPVPLSFVGEMKGLYPAVDVEQQLREMRAWCIGNPTKRKTSSGIKRFITSWLSRAQDGAKSGVTQQPRYSGNTKKLWGDYIPTQEEYEEGDDIIVVGK